MRRSSRPSISPPIPQETWLDRQGTQFTYEGTTFDLVQPRQHARQVPRFDPAIPTHVRSPSANPDSRSDRATRHPSVRYKRSQSTTPETRLQIKTAPPRSTARPHLTAPIPSAFYPPVDVPARPASAPPESPIARSNPPPPYEAVRPPWEEPTQIPLPGTMASRSPDLSRTLTRERSHSGAQGMGAMVSRSPDLSQSQTRERSHSQAQNPESSRRDRVLAPQAPPTTGQGQAGEKFGRKAKTFFKEIFRRGSVDQEEEEVEVVQVKHWADDDDY